MSDLLNMNILPAIFEKKPIEDNNIMLPPELLQKVRFLCFSLLDHPVDKAGNRWSFTRRRCCSTHVSLSSASISQYLLRIRSTRRDTLSRSSRSLSSFHNDHSIWPRYLPTCVIIHIQHFARQHRGIVMLLQAKQISLLLYAGDEQTEGEIDVLQ